MTPETRLKKQIQKCLRDSGGWHISLAMLTVGGIPDMICIKRRVFFVETKTPKGKVTPLQDWTINKIKMHGGEVHVIRSLKEFKEIM